MKHIQITKNVWNDRNAFVNQIKMPNYIYFGHFHRDQMFGNKSNKHATINIHTPQETTTVVDGRTKGEKTWWVER